MIFFRNVSILLFAGLLSSGCDSEMLEKLGKQVKQLSVYREQAEVSVPQYPYKKDQHQAFKNYFSEIGRMLSVLSNHVDDLEEFNEWLNGTEFSSFCPTLFMGKDIWAELQKHCEKNGFYLCTEEAKAYPEMIKSFKKYLNSKNLNRFETEPRCDVFGVL